MCGAHLYVGSISLAHLPGLIDLKYTVSLSALGAYVLGLIVMT